MENTLFLNADKLNDKEFYAIQLIRFSSYTNKSIGILNNKIFFINKRFINKIKTKKHNCISYSSINNEKILVEYFNNCNELFIGLDRKQIIFLKLKINMNNSKMIYNFDRRVKSFPFIKH